MRKILFWTLGITTIVGTTVLAWFYLFNMDGTVLNTIQVHSIEGTNLKMYEFKLHVYLKNISNSVELFQFIVPPFPEEPNVDWNLFNAIPALTKWLFFIINVIIWILNMYLILPIRILMYIFIVIISLLGLNGTYLFNNIKEVYDRLLIPFLQYSWIS